MNEFEKILEQNEELMKKEKLERIKRIAEKAKDLHNGKDTTLKQDFHKFYLKNLVSEQTSLLKKIKIYLIGKIFYQTNSLIEKGSKNKLLKKIDKFLFDKYLNSPNYKFRSEEEILKERGLWHEI